jgi:hypothetical protein
MNNILLCKTSLCLSSLAGLVVLSSGLSVNAQMMQPGNQASIPANVITPVPGSVATSSMALSPDYGSEQSAPETKNQVSQAAEPKVKVGRATRGGSSYIGIGGNIGLAGSSSSLADGNFAVISKIGITRNFSVRPGAVLGDNTTILIPVTYDFASTPVDDKFAEPQAIAPYIGVGAAIKTGDKSDTAVLVTGGVDVPLNNQFTANLAVNAGFFSQTDVGLMLGVGYNFGGF